MPQFRSMDEEKVSIKKTLLPLPPMKKKKIKRLSWLLLSQAQVLSLKTALICGCTYAVPAAYLLHDRQQGPRCPCPCQCQEPEPELAWAWAWFVRRYVLTDGDAVDALLRGLLWCCVLQTPAAALALALLAGGRRRLGVRAAACVALAAAAAGHWMYIQWLGLHIDGALGNVVFAVETVCFVANAAFGLVGFTAFVLGVGGDDEQAGRARAG